MSVLSVDMVQLKEDKGNETCLKGNESTAGCPCSSL